MAADQKKNIDKRIAKLEKDLAAKNHELEIEAALERVRARAMSMQHSDELADLVATVFRELTALGFKLTSCIIWIHDNDTSDTLWIASAKKNKPARPFRIHPFHNSFFKSITHAWKTKDPEWIYTLKGSEKKSFEKAFFKEIPDLPETLRRALLVPKQVAFSASFNNFGALEIVETEALTAEKFDILHRFGKVFDLSYTRFNDLKKAEAQAREAEIELALERVRARTMAMQKSEELKETTLVLFQQFKSLGATTAQVSICVFDEDTKMGEMFVTLKGEKIDRSFPMELDKEVFVMKKAKKAFLDKQKKFSYTIKGKELQNYNRWRNLLIGKKGWDESDAVRKRSWHVNAVFFSRGMIGISSDTPPSDETLKLLDRFANVFDLTFTRFLDLQKAEAQAREAMIEAGLERVRSRAMAMQSSEELGALIGTMFTELTKLDLVLTRCVIWIIDHKTNDAVWWMANSEDASHPMSYSIPYHEQPPWLAFINEWKKRTLKWVYDLKGQTKKDWDDHLFSKTGLAEMPKFISDGMKAPKRVLLSASFNNFGGINVASLEPLSEEHFDILLRFAKVFDLTYTRFNDLKQAEAQARESQIQLALERVRARTMAMHKSEELIETSALLLDQFTQLGYRPERMSVGIYNEQSRKVEIWTTGLQGDNRLFEIPFEEPQVFAKSYRALKSKQTSLVVNLSGENLKDYIKYWNSLGYRYPASETIERLVVNVAYFSRGHIGFISADTVPETTIKLLERFAAVFDLTYTRYLDLKKAEAQAREAEIQLALERVRARTMAMQHSDELKHAAALLFQQVKALGVPAYSCGYNIWENNEKIFTSWMSTQDGSDFNGAPNIPLTEDANFIRYVRSRQEGEEFFVLELRGQRMQEHYQYLKTIPAFRAWFDYAEQMGFALPETQIHHLANFSHGNLLFITLEPCPEFHDVFKRFAAVFEQTYTRFLDLQKAEAQAREAQIESSLERVRAQALGMHKPDDLLNVCKILFRELSSLGFDEIRNAIIHKYNDEKKYFIDYDYSDFSGGAIINIPYSDQPVIKSFLKQVRKSDEALAEITITGKELNDWKKFRKSGGQPDDPRLDKNPALYYYCYSVGTADIGISTFNPLNQENLQLLRRYRNVFEFAYKRYEDITKAEAQTREAQIELALERVRARTMAMHKSEELAETAQVMFHQLQELGGIPDRIAIGVVDEQTGVVNFWSTDQTGSHIDKKFHARLNERTVMSKTYQAWKDQKRSLVIDLHGEELKEWIQFVRDEMDMTVKDDFIKDRRVHTGAFFSHGWILVTTHEPQSAETIQILERFASVFNLTYRRFLDLEKAEAQANEARIEISLERIRARALAMHRSDELIEVAKVLWEQMTILGQRELEASAVHLYEIDPDHIHSWRAVSIGPDANPELTYGHMAIPKNSCELVREWLENFYGDLTEYTIELSGAKQDEWYDVLFKLAPDVAVSMRQKNDPHEKRYYRFSKFSGGALLMISKKAPAEDVSYLQKRAAAVFDLAYRRFSDLQKAEAQAREAQIEAALERVRAKAMAMHKTEDLNPAVAVVFEEMEKLDLGTLRCGIGILSKEKIFGDVWTTHQSAAGIKVQVSGNESMDIHPLLQGAYAAWLKLEDFSYILKGEDMSNYYHALTKTDFHLPESQLVLTASEETKQYYYVTPFEAGTLFAFRATAFPEEAKTVMKRFANVFNLTYKRFLDLQKAEANAREAQIEASLERVRSKTMAMHNSNDVGHTVAAMFDELVKLGIETIRCGVGIMHEGAQMELWTARPGEKGKADLVIGWMNMSLHPLHQGAYANWKNKGESYSYELKGDDLVNYFTVVNNHPDYPVRYDIDALPKQLFHNEFCFPEGILFAFSVLQLQEEQRKVLKRFAGVFGQTYRRYLDLQKAEAQAKEAQIETSLERVRAKAMAMHSSKDLAETIGVFYRELKSLSVTPRRCGVALMDKETRLAELTTMNTTEEGDSIEVVGQIKMSGHPVLDNVFENWLKQKEYHAVLRGNQIKEYYQVLKPQISYPDYPHDVVQYGYYFMFKEGDVYAWTESELAEDHLKIYRRFASVISLTYKRYLDLKQAEAQAKEAQIEAGLERVRARTMAMHSSDDVSAATATMFTELEKLGVQNYRGGITNILSNRTQDVWSVNNLAEGKVLKAVGAFSVDSHPFWQLMFKEWEAKKDFTHYFLAGQDKEEYIGILNTTQGYLSQPLQQFPDVHFQVYYFNEGAIWTNSLQPHSEEDKQIMKRFTSVFSLTFRRYQDLKKAEAQAREATIEAALEKVRGKAMAMHNSNDLSVTASMIFTELRKLGINPVRCGVSLQTKDSRKNLLYYAIPSADGDNLSLAGSAFLSGHPVLSAIYDYWLRGEDYFPVLKGESLINYYQTLKQVGFDVPVSPTGHEQHGYYLAFSEGMFYGWSEKPFAETEIKILKRFASVIDLTFRRYMELQKSEANAREAIKQAALDRIRADIASMRTITDLDRITPLIWNELTILGIPFIRCGVFIMDESQQLIHTFLSTPDGKAIAAFHLPYDTPGNISKVIDNWRHKKIYIDHWGEEEFTQFADILMKQRALVSREQYLNTIPGGGFYLHFLPFLQGMLYVGNTTQLNEEAIELIQHVSDAFSTAYARYEDFNKLEAAKKQVENTLTDLKQAQQQLVQSEKMASLGELTAGIAHEIQNPLNFVNNFSDVSNELLEEMKTELEKGNKDDAIAIVEDVKQNLEKILHHGKRADAIVKGMLQHSRTSSGQKEMTDINVLADEYLRLAYHGLRAKDKTFNAKFETHFDNNIGKVNIIPQDIGRVILNLINNAFYTVTEKKKHAGNGYEPTVTVSTIKENGKVEIKVTDNGNGIPQKVLDKIFQPFFTTKPTGQGTGLGLSLAYDIITKGHGGELKVETKEGEGSEFIIQLPNQS